MRNVKLLPKRLQELESKLYSRIPLIGWKLRRDAAKALVADGSPEAINVLAEAVTHSADSKVQRIALQSLLKWAGEEKPEAQEALCCLVIEHNHSFAREVLLAAQYAPRDSHQRALFYFLTEQWDQYDALDFDQNLLKTVYETLAPEMRKRLAACARRDGRLEWVNIVVRDRQGKRLGEMTDTEWEATLALLSDQRQWVKLWQLAQESPAVWSVRMLLRLKEAAWTPEQNVEKTAFPELVQLAEACHKLGAPCQFGYCDASLTGHTDEIFHIAISPDGQILVSSGGEHDPTVCLWNLPERKIVHTLDVWAPAFIRPDGRTFITGGEPVCLWNLSDGTLLETFIEETSSLPYQNRSMFAAMSPDGHILAGWGYSEPCFSVILGNLSDLPSLQISNFGVIGYSNCLAFAPDGHMLATSENQTILLWSVPNGHQMKRLEGHSHNVRGVAFSPDGQMLASGGEDTTIRLWNLSDGTVSDGKVLNTLEGHTETVTCVAFSPDGRVLASGSSDKTIRLWMLPDGKPLQTLTGHTDQITCITMSPDGKFLASGSYDTTIRLWNLALANILHLPIRQTTTEDMRDIAAMLQQSTTPNSQRLWLEFVQALMHWQRRFDVEVGEMPKGIPAGEFDIELG